MNVLLLIIHLFAHVRVLAIHWNSAQEAKHGGQTIYEQPPIVHEFQKSVYAKSKESRMNLFSIHLKLIQSFCQVRRPKGCTWKDFYHLLDYLRESYKTQDDTGKEDIGSISVEQVHNWLNKTAPAPRMCKVISEPTASEFFKYVLSNQPFIIRGLAKKWPALTKWTIDYLTNLVKHDQVICSCVMHSTLNLCNRYTLAPAPLEISLVRNQALYGPLTEILTLRKSQSYLANLLISSSRSILFYLLIAPKSFTAERKTITSRWRRRERERGPSQQ
jgi:hypothetical protein